MADRYWVGGNGTWNATNTTNWSDQSGGLGGFSVPTANDDVFFNAASSAVGYTVTTPANTTAMICRNLNVAAPATGNVVFSNTNSTVNIYGGINFSSTGIVWNASVAFLFRSTTAGNTITSNGFNFLNSWTFNGVGGVWALQDNVTLAATRTVTLTAGTLDLVDKTLSTGLFNSNNSNVRTLAFGTGNITLTGNNTNILVLTTATNLTVTGTPVVNCTYSGATGTRSINGGGATTYSALNPKVNVNITAGTDIIQPGGNNVFGNINFNGFTGSYAFTASDPQLFGNLTFDAGMTGPSSATRSLLFNATSGTQTITTNGVTINSGIIVQGGSTCVFADALTMGATNTLTFSAGTIQLKNGVTSTVGNFVANNSNVKFLQSTTPGSQATLSQASGTVNVVDLNIRDINAVGGASWNAYTDFENTDAGNNDGWNFSLSPPYSTAELPVTLRPFTQPRRF